MAAIALGVVGTAIGSSIGGVILGVSAATIGGMIGASVGSVVDSWIIGAMAGGETQRIEGSRLDAARLTGSAEGAVIPQVFGRMRLGGNVIWATDFREEIVTDRQRVGGGKGGGRKTTVETTTYLYYASFAVALCEGPITGIGRIWADGMPMDLEGVTLRWYSGDESQEPDPFIKAKTGPEAPAYRGTAYVVFEELLLEKFGNRIPQLTFEVFRALDEPDTAEGAVKAVTIIPGSGEFVYATSKVSRHFGGGETAAENINVSATTSDFREALDRLQAAVPGIESVSLVVAWFGSDLRAGNCQVRPGVEIASKTTTPISWEVGGISRGQAYLVSRIDGRPAYGGTPADMAVVQAIQECKARGLRVTFYPFVMMDIPEGNSLPNPYSDNAASVGQPGHPWRGRITCSPAAGYAGTVDKTPTAAAQVAAFFGNAGVNDFKADITVDLIQGATNFFVGMSDVLQGGGEKAFFDFITDLITGSGAVEGWSLLRTSIKFLGDANDWGYRRMVLHYAFLCASAGGVDSFIIGSELRGLTQVRSGAGTYPAVTQLISLAGDVRQVLGDDVKISYAADWSEYFGHQPGDGSGDVYFHLDPLWASPNIDFVGIDNYMPLSDWRDGFEHADAQEFESIYERGYLQANIEGGEGFDWYYASSGDRAAQNRTPITDGGAGKPWVFRYKDFRAWWSNQHFNRPGGIESATPTEWVPESKPIRFTEFGCPAVDRGTNQPNVFFDPKSAESFVPYFSRGWRDDAIQRAYIEAVLLYWRDSANNPASSVYSGRMIDVDECAVWTWDARPYPWFPSLEDVWSDGENWRLGHWLTGRLGAVSLPALVRYLCGRAGLAPEFIDVSQLWGSIEGYMIGALESPRASISMLGQHFGFDAVESEGRIVFRMRGRAPVASLTLDELVPPEGGNGDVIEFVREQETELPQALKWTVARSDEEYDAATVEARRITVEAARVNAVSFPVAVPPEEAERRARRALQETWVSREGATFRLPPSRIALDPADVVTLEHDGRTYDLRLLTTNDGLDRAITAVRQDRDVYDMPPGEERSAVVARSILFGQAQAVGLDLPLLSEDQTPHHPLLAAYARPWPGTMAVYRSLTIDGGFELVTHFETPARFAVTVEDFHAGPTSRFDMGNALVIDLQSGTLESVTDLLLFDGANALAVETAPNVWEIVQAGKADLIAPGRYRLTRLLRGRRGTESAIAATVEAGARVVVLDGNLAPVAVALGDLDRTWHWLVGPAGLPHSDEAYVGAELTPRGRGLRPFSVCHVEQPYLRGRTPGDLTIRWKRRSRELAADSWALAEVPLGEDFEAYEVDILDGDAVVRTLMATTTSVVYSSADQTADWGAPLGPGQTLTIRIAQMSALIGRGEEREFTLQF